MAKALLLVLLIALFCAVVIALALYGYDSLVFYDTP